jgi:hypothetical protein
MPIYSIDERYDKLLKECLFFQQSAFIVLIPFYGILLNQMLNVVIHSKLSKILGIFHYL